MKKKTVYIFYSFLHAVVLLNIVIWDLTHVPDTLFSQVNVCHRLSVDGCARENNLSVS